MWEIAEASPQWAHLYMPWIITSHVFFWHLCLFHSLSAAFLMIFGHWNRMYLVKGLQSVHSSHGLWISWRDALHWPKSITIRSAWKHKFLVFYVYLWKRTVLYSFMRIESLSLWKLDNILILFDVHMLVDYVVFLATILVLFIMDFKFFAFL